MVEQEISVLASVVEEEISVSKTTITCFNAPSLFINTSKCMQPYNQLKIALCNRFAVSAFRLKTQKYSLTLEKSALKKSSPDLDLSVFSASAITA